MALTITTQPELYSLSNNEIKYIVNSSVVINDGVYMYARVSLIFRDGIKVWTKILGTDLSVIIENNALFDFSGYLSEEKKGHFEFSSGLVEYDLLQKFKVEFFLLDENEAEIEIINDVKFYIYGALDFMKQLNFSNAQTSFYNYFFVGKNMLSFANIPNSINDDEDYFFYFFNKTEGNYILNVFITYIDGTQFTYSDSKPIAEYKIVFANIGYKSLIEPIATKEVLTYIVTITTKAPSTSGESRPITYLYKKFAVKPVIEQKTKFVFKNQLGVYEVIYFKGLISEKNIFDRVNSSNNGLKQVISSENEITYKANSGFISKPKYNNFLDLIRYSKDSFVEIEGNMIPIVITNTDISERKSDVFLFDIEISYSLSFKNHA